MGMSLSGGGSGSRRRSSGTTLSEINVTPFVDVVLVLLIIFMLTAHVMEYGMEVDVPQVRYVQNTAQELPIVTIDKTGASTLNGKTVNIHNISAEVRAKFPTAKGVYVKADKDTIWDAMAQVIAELGAGKLVVYMVTQPADSPARK